MIFQLLKKPDDTWEDFTNKYDITATEVLRRIAKHRDQKFSELNVINNSDDGKNKRSFFYDCISTLGTLSLSGPFIVVQHACP